MKFNIDYFKSRLEDAFDDITSTMEDAIDNVSDTVEDIIDDIDFDVEDWFAKSSPVREAKCVLQATYVLQTTLSAEISAVREGGEGSNTYSTNIPTVSSSNIQSETIDQPRMDPPRHVSPPQQHQVFISFRGELRNNFISHLDSALRSNRINVFIDTQENRGVPISNLLKRIEDSRIAVVVFSSKYTESKWCLKEAEKIKELAAQGKLEVIPIFYKVTPENVKQLKGEFGDHFRDREREYHNDKSVIEKWKEAIKFISGNLGFVLDNRSNENVYISSIVKEVLRILTSQ